MSVKYCQLQKKVLHIFYLAEYFINMLSLRWKLNLLIIYFECFLHQSPTCWPDTVSASTLKPVWSHMWLQKYCSFSNATNKYQACTVSHCKTSGWGWKSRFCWWYPCIFNQNVVSAEISVLNNWYTLIYHWQHSRVLQSYKNL